MHTTGSRDKLWKKRIKKFYSLDFIVHIFNIRTQEAVASGSLLVQGQPDQHRAFQASKGCLQNNRQKNHFMAGEMANGIEDILFLLKI